MPRNTKRKYRQVIDYIEDEVGVDIPRDVKKTAIESIEGSAQEDGVPINIEKIAGVDQSGANLLAALQSVSDNDELRIAIETDNEGILKTQDQPFDVSYAEVDVDLASQTLSQLASNIEQIGGQAQSAVDVADKIDQIEDALASVGSDSLRVTSPNPLDVSGAEVDVDIATQSLSPLTVTDDGSLAISAYNGSTLPVEQQTAVALEDSGGTGISPLAQRDLPVGTDPSTGAEDNLRTQAEFDLSHVGSAVADGSQAFVVVLNNPAGSGVEAFASVQINGSGLAELDKAENITVDSAGTALDAIPKNTQSGDTPTITVEQGGTYTVNGTEISSLTSGSVSGGGNSQSSGGVSPLDSGFRLPEGTSRLYRVTNASGSESSYAIDIKLKEIDNA